MLKEGYGGAIDAKQIGLVDEIGGIDKAVETAATLAKLKTYRITSLPEEKEFFKQLMESISGEDVKTQFMKNQLGENYIYFENLKKASEMKGIQARLPFNLIIN